MSDHVISPSKNKLSKSTIISIMVSAVALLISVVSLLFQVFPQINCISVDYVAKAKAGDEQSQLYLAEQCYHNGEYDSAINWYKIIAEKNGKYKDVAYNNLGWLYINGYGLSELGQYDSMRYEKALKCFLTAYELGSETGKRNAIITIKLPSFNRYGKMKDEIDGFMNDNNISLEESEDKTPIESHYRCFNIYHGKYYTFENYHYTYSGSRTIIENGLTTTAYEYYGVVYDTDGQVKNCIFILLNT